MAGGLERLGAIAGKKTGLARLEEIAAGGSNTAKTAASPTALPPMTGKPGAGAWLPDSVRAQMEVKTPAVGVAKPVAALPTARDYRGMDAAFLGIQEDEAGRVGADYQREQMDNTLARATTQSSLLKKGQALEQTRNPGAENVDPGKWLLKNLEAGWQAMGSGLAATYDFLLPTELLFGDEDDLMSKINRDLRTASQDTTQTADEMSRKKGGLYPVAGKLTQGTVGALPNAVMAVVSGGTSVPAQLGAQAGGLSATLTTAVSSLAKNPGFWMANAQTLGNSYESAKAGGANEMEATATALINSFLSSAVEVGGGIETLPASLARDTSESGVRLWVRSMLEEGREEVVQSVIENMTQKAIYDKDKPFVSLQDENAIFNPGRMAEEFAMGAGVGGILGGGQVLAGNIAARRTAADTNGQANAFVPGSGLEGQNKTASTEETALPRMSMADFTDVKSQVWNNVEYGDTQTRADIQGRVHQEMVDAGQVVHIPESTVKQVDQSFPDLRTLKKAERTPILKQKMNELKSALRGFLSGLKGGSYEFEVNGNILEARLYDTGVKEVMEKVTQDKASMLYHSDELFKGARYLYSTLDSEGDPNIYRWNYFYTPVEIGGETVGVRIAVRDVVKGTDLTPESQIYNWGIKKDTTLDGGSRGPKVASSGVSSVASVEGDPVSARGDNGTSPPPAWTQSPSSDPTIAPRESGVKVNWPAGPREGPLGDKGQDMQRGVGVYAPPGESIDSLVEQTYNETEPDHRELPELPELISPMEQALIEREWDGGERMPGDAESEVADILRRAAKSVGAKGKVVGFEQLPEGTRRDFRAGLSKAAAEAKEVLRQSYRKTDYIVRQGQKSYYRNLSNTVELGQDAPPSTLAHELFHQLDRGGAISKQFVSALAQDHVALNVVSGGDIKGYLMEQYPEAFLRHKVSGKSRLMEHYRGIADIINGLTAGKINLGYYHSDNYWAQAGTLETEAWAQLGRILYENDAEVIKMLSELFPNLMESAIMALKGLI